MLGKNSEGTFDAERLAPLSAELADTFRETCDVALDQIRRGTHVPYSPGRRPDRHEIVATELDTVAPLVAALGSVESHNRLDIFEIHGDLANRVDLYVVAIEADEMTHFLRRTSSRRRLKQTNRIAAIWRGQAFETLVDDPLLFDTTFDAVVQGNDVYILNQTSFERSLGFLEAAREAAETTVRSAISALKIANADEFLKAVTSDVNMISKTRSIAERLTDPGYGQRMTIDNLIAVAERHPQIELDWETDEDGENALVFHSDPQRRWRILKLLDDDFVQSVVTEFVYEANSKYYLE